MPAKPQIQAILLTIVAGIADAVGYIVLGGVFAANMTGNTVLAGIAAAEGFHELAADRLAPLLTFFLGAMLARLCCVCGKGRWCRCCSRRSCWAAWDSCPSAARSPS